MPDQETPRMLNSERTCDQSEFEKGMWTSRRPQSTPSTNNKTKMDRHHSGFCLEAEVMKKS